jgi:murein DD-endopeptidase MepM/ murein hydrolase activator NlpD
MWHWLQGRVFGGKKLTFLYVPDNASVRQFMVPRVAFYALAGVFVLGLGLIAFFGSRYLSAAAEGRHLLSLRGENLELRDQLLELQQQVAGLQTEMKSSLALQEQLRNIASLDPANIDMTQSGVGGPAPAVTTTEQISPEVRTDLQTVSRNLGQLLAQAKAQRSGYNDIMSALEGKRATWDHTPSVRPLQFGSITSHYGRRTDPFTGQLASHRGLDFAARPGTPIRATAAGVVTDCARAGGYGLLIEIDHGNGLVTRYAHCSAITVKPGDRVERGDLIGRVGATGRASGSHVHYEVLKNGIQLDPMNFVLPTDVVVD